MNSVKSVKVISGHAIKEFCAGDISPISVILEWAFHYPPKPPFSCFVQDGVIAGASDSRLYLNIRHFD